LCGNLRETLAADYAKKEKDLCEGKDHQHKKALEELKKKTSAEKDKEII